MPCCWAASSHRSSAGQLKLPSEGLRSFQVVYVSHSLILPKETEGQGIPENSADWTCIENSVRGIPLAGGAEELPRAPTAIVAAVEERRVGAHLLSLDCACELGGKARTTIDSEMISAKIRGFNLTKFSCVM
jgi:hypothetical protein